MSATGTALDMNDSVSNGFDRVSRAQFMRLSGWFTLTLCVMAAVLSALFGRSGVWSALNLTELVTSKTLLGGVLGLVIGAFLVLLGTLWHPLHALVERLANLVAWETLRKSDYVAVAFMAALSEELLFRGALQPLIGLVPVAIIFGLLHATAIAHVILAGLLGFVLGWLYHWSGSLWPPIVAHLAIDLITGLFIARTLGACILSAQGD